MGRLKTQRTDADRRADVMRMRVVDDVFFERFIDDPDACEELIQTVLENPNIRIKPETLVPQKSIHFVANRSIRVDAYAEDTKDKVYNIEIQRFDTENHVKRVRYNASAITVHDTEPGETFDNVRNVIVIYISEFDVFGLGKTMYHARTVLKETGTVVDNGIEAIYVNTEHDDGSSVAKLMQLYKQSNFADDRFPKSSARMQTLKHDDVEVRHMGSIMKEVAAQAKVEGAIETAEYLIALHKLSIEEIAASTKLPLEEVRKLVANE